MNKEELINKYIKYDSSITEEGFNAIIKKLEEACIPNHPSVIRASFTKFKEEGYIFNLNYSNEGYYIGTAINSGDVEIKVSDILGGETNFEVGKWYSFYWNWNSGYSHIGKVGRIYTCGNETTICFNYSINTSSSSDSNTKEKSIDLAEIENIKELTLEEIQQYLPDNHPDKILKESPKVEEPKPSTVDDLVEGEIYYCENTYLTGGRHGYVFLKNGDNGIKHLVIEGLKFLKKGWSFWTDKDTINLRLATSEEKHWLLTCIKQDEFIPKEDLSKYDSEGDLIEVISKPETKEIQLSDLKNPIFNVGDKVRVIADSLREFNDSFCSGNNSDFKKGYEGIVTKINSCKSTIKEVDSWCQLDNCKDLISCNLLELVEPVKKEFDRDWYVEVNSQEEADLVFQYLESVGEKLGDAFDKEWTRNWKYVIQNNNKWICDGIKNNKPQKQLSDILPNYSSEPKVNRNVYYEVETQEQYNEILDWLESKGEMLYNNARKLTVNGNWKYVVFDLGISGSWALYCGKKDLLKAEFQFKNKSKTQPIKTGPGSWEQIAQYQNQYEYKTIDSSSVWEILMNPPTQNSRAKLKQEPIKLVSFEEDDIVLFKTNSVKISNKQLIIND